MQQHGLVSSNRCYGTVPKVLYKCSDEDMKKSCLLLEILWAWLRDTEIKLSDSQTYLGGGRPLVTLLSKHEEV